MSVFLLFVFAVFVVVVATTFLLFLMLLFTFTAMVLIQSRSLVRLWHFLFVDVAHRIVAFDVIVCDGFPSFAHTPPLCMCALLFIVISFIHPWRAQRAKFCQHSEYLCNSQKVSMLIQLQVYSIMKK